MAENISLVGHDNPLGYPGPVIPILATRGGGLFAAYATDRATLIPIPKTYKFTPNSTSTNRSLVDFDAFNERLFGLAKGSIERYQIDEEPAFFAKLLSRHDFSIRNPFLRLSLAKETCNRHLLYLELLLCSRVLEKQKVKLTRTWYFKQRVDIAETFGVFELLLFPDQFKELPEYLSKPQLEFLALCEAELREPATPTSDAKSSTTRVKVNVEAEKLVGRYNKARKKSVSEAFEYLEPLLMSRRHVIRHSLRRYLYDLPVWISAEDIELDVMTRLFTSVERDKLPQFKSSSHFDAYLVTMTKYVALDTARDYRRMKRGATLTHRIDDLKAEPPGYTIERQAELSELVDNLRREVCKDALEISLLNHFLTGHNRSEMANVLGLSVSLVSNKWARLRARMSTWIQEHAPEFDLKM